MIYVGPDDKFYSYAPAAGIGSATRRDSDAFLSTFAPAPQPTDPTDPGDGTDGWYDKNGHFHPFKRPPGHGL